MIATLSVVGTKVSLGPDTLSVDKTYENIDYQYVFKKLFVPSK